MVNKMIDLCADVNGFDIGFVPGNIDKALMAIQGKSKGNVITSVCTS